MSKIPQGYVENTKNNIFIGVALISQTKETGQTEKTTKNKWKE